jgi:hypothetical protein
MSREYQKQIANKIKNINQRYVAYEDKKELVGGNYTELVDVKNCMGLKGKGMASTSLPAGAGLSAAGGMKKYKKGKGKMEDVEVCEECGGPKGAGLAGAGLAGAGIGDVLKGFLQNFNPLYHISNAIKGKWDEGKKYGKRYGGAEPETVNILETPLRLTGYDDDGDEVMKLEGSGILDLLNPFKILHTGMKFLTGGGMSGGVKYKLYGKKGGIGEFQELEGAGVDSIVKTFENEMGKGMSGGCDMCEGEGKKKRATHFTGGKMNSEETRNTNQALMGSGVSGGAILGYYGDAPQLLKPKRKMMKGKGLMDTLLKVVNAPMDLANKFVGVSSPFESIANVIGKDKVRNVLGKAVGLDKALGIEEKEGGKKRKMKGKGMGERPTTQNMHSSSFSGGKKSKKVVDKPKKINKRAEIVKRVMKEQGLGLIEASKYVKANNLY